MTLQFQAPPVPSGVAGRATRQLARHPSLQRRKFSQGQPPDRPTPSSPSLAASGGPLQQHEDSHSNRGKAGSTSTGATLMSVDADELAPGFKSRRLLCFAGITLGYMGTYFTRGSLTYTAPVLVADPGLNIRLTDIGAMTSAFPLAYGVSKFLSGVLGTKFSNRAMLAYGLLITAALNLAFGFAGGSVGLMTTLWFLNGMVQGAGAPACAGLLTRWFASKERGTYWALWNAGANMGGFLTPVAVGYLAKQFGWQWGMWAPGLAGAVLAVFALYAIRDSPEAAGYPPPEQPGRPPAGVPAVQPAGSRSSIRAALLQVVRNPGIWALAFAYFFVYIGATSWLVFYLMAAKGVPDAAQAANTVSGLELGGLALALAALAALAALVALVVLTYVVGVVGVLAALKAVPPEARWLQWLVVAALGFCIYGPHVLIGLCGAELVSKSAVGASQGLLGLVAYMGAANAGIPLSWVVHHHGWDGYFTGEVFG
ncbi:hypothetical protein QJQ45_030275 [Haematococcus lacustris]|nr:hypothetical protein QJQ45_030275 [Haematococcus lacustris]